MSRTFNLLAQLTLIGWMIVIAIYTYWSVYPYKPLVITNQPLPVNNTDRKVEQGGTLSYNIDYCHSDLEVQYITKFFIDGIVYALPPISGVKVPVGCGSITIVVQIPEKLPLGEYHVQTVYHYQVNPIRELDIVTTTERFEVVK